MNAPSLQLSAFKCENMFVRDADASAFSEPVFRSLSLASAPPSRPLPPPPAATFAPPSSHFFSPPPAQPAAVAVQHPAVAVQALSQPIAHPAVAIPVPSTAAECRRVFESEDVDALSNLFGRTQISLLQSTFTIKEETHAVELLGIPVKKGSMLEEDFLIAIQNYIISHPRPSSALASTASHNVSHSAPQASAVAVQHPAVAVQHPAVAVQHPAVAVQPLSQPALSVPLQVSPFTPASSASTAPAFAGQGIGRKDKVSQNKCKQCKIMSHRTLFVNCNLGVGLGLFL